MSIKTKENTDQGNYSEEELYSSTPYQSKNKIRFVTAASLFDGHDASINIMRRILQSSGAEVIHLGHNRSVHEVVNCAIQEDVQGIAISSYQGGHVEYFKYMIELLRENGAEYIKVFGGGGGVIVPEEIEDLHRAGVTRIFSVEDGSKMGLQGMINYMLKECDFDPVKEAKLEISKVQEKEVKTLAKCITALEAHHEELIEFKSDKLLLDNEKELLINTEHKIPLIGITGTGGAGKSSLTDELVRRFLTEFEDLNIAIVSVDPSRLKTGGALLGDRIRMNSIDTPRVYMRSLATRASNRSTSEALEGVIQLYKAAGFDLIIVETSGIGQSGTEIVDLTDISVYVMTSEYGAATQLEKINMLDLADFVVLNKFEKKGSKDALRDVRKQMQRNSGQWHANPESMPVFPTIAAQFNDEGVNRLFSALVDEINAKYELTWEKQLFTDSEPATDIEAQAIIPGKRVRYLSEISESVRDYHVWVEKQVEIASKWDEVRGTIEQLKSWKGESSKEMVEQLSAMRAHWEDHLGPLPRKILDEWDALYEKYKQDEFVVQIRDKKIANKLYHESLSGLKIPRVALPDTKHAGERLRFALKENLPGYFPFTAGVFPFKRQGEDPTRMFAGEGTPERTNKRFHFVSEGLPAARLSTAFDSVTLYGEDPGYRPDIYGKIGNSGVSICTLDDMKKLYSGFELTAPTTSVSMTINGPAPMILAMFMNTTIDQEVERYLRAEGK
ncbi:MAG: methylmalonyl-CoA mutase family protein, partial [Balneolales bacterium]|nr:methylmalonyl-CoA mutase family protein [Balneolales bacterium]